MYHDILLSSSADLLKARLHFMKDGNIQTVIFERELSLLSRAPRSHWLEGGFGIQLGDTALESLLQWQ